MKNFNLQIPKPCSENWNSFKTTANGGFCTTCSNTVVDFTKMNDREIIDFFTMKPAHTCGRFRSDQLKHYVLQPISEIKPGFGLLKAGLLCLAIALMNSPATAQTLALASATEHNVKLGKVQQSVSLIKEYTIRGIVKANDNEALQGVNILLKGTTRGTVTDENGRFEFPKLAEGDVLQFSFIGMVTREYTVTNSLEAVVEIGMVLDEAIMLGAVAVGEDYSPKQPVFHRIWNKVKNVF